MVVFLDPEQDESEDELLSDGEWNSLLPAVGESSKLNPRPLKNTHLLPDRPLHMSLRSRRK